MIAPDTILAMAQTPAGLAALFQGTLEGAAPHDLRLADVVSDSRDVTPGSAFVALPGPQHDGHDHVAEAARRGAALAVVDRDWQTAADRPALLLRVPGPASALRSACTRRLEELGCTVIGITGSVGKTTVKEMCAHVLGDTLRVARTAGNLNTWTGVPLSVLRIEGPADVFVAELAMSASGEIRDLAAFSRPRVGVLLNIGLAHVGPLGSIEAIAEAKAELLEALPPDGVAILNADDLRVASLASRSRAPAVWFGIERPADIRALRVEAAGLAGSTFVLEGPGGAAPVRLAMAGRHAVLDACAAAAVAVQLGMGMPDIARRLETFTVPARRGRVVVGREKALIYDDCYNSSPTSLEAALEVLRGSGAGERIAVLGDMLELGARSPAEHEAAGRRAAAAATSLVAVGESASTVGRAAIEAGMPPDRVAVVPDAQRAAAITVGLVDGAPGAGRVAVLVKGSRAVGLETVVEALTR